MRVPEGLRGVKVPVFGHFVAHLLEFIPVIVTYILHEIALVLPGAKHVREPILIELYEVKFKLFRIL